MIYLLVVIYQFFCKKNVDFIYLSIYIYNLKYKKVRFIIKYSKKK